MELTVHHDGELLCVDAFTTSSSMCMRRHISVVEPDRSIGASDWDLREEEEERLRCAEGRLRMPAAHASGTRMCSGKKRSASPWM